MDPNQSPKKLLQEALKARKRAYCPYSKNAVGAALLAASGKIYTGANVENAVNGLSVCAEQVALFKAVSEGERRFEKLAVVCESPNYCRPCGACRQVLLEFAPQIEIIMGNTKCEYEIASLKELLPQPFEF